MFPSNSNNDRSFSAQSRASFLAPRNDACITEYESGPTAAPAPTAAPTPFTCSNPNEVSFTLELLTDDYPGETTWTVTNEVTGAVAGSGGPYSQTGTSFTETICIPVDACLFTINDSYGDGICCSVSYNE